MRRRNFRIVTVLAVAASAMLGTACADHHRHEGPAQHAGREVDHAVGKAGDALEHAGHKVNQALPHDE
jgi:hypothetical protein